MMTDRDLRELCHRFFDAVENGDIGTVREIYAPDMKFWINLTDQEKTGEENIAVLEAGKAKARRRTYDDRRINTFHNGFVCQFSCNVTTLDGRKISLSSALVVRCSNDQIIRIDEYMDSSKMSAPPKAA